MIVVLTGGTGAAKFMQGLQQVAPARELVAIVNTGDDLVWWGLHVSPDVDSITYGLAGLLSSERGWGVERDTFECLARMRAMGAPAWFSLGDRDLALHILRTELLAAGQTLTEVTAHIAKQLAIQSSILPMSDQRVETRVATPAGDLNFQEYFVRERHQVAVTGVRFAGSENARPAPGVLDAIAAADAIIIAPSNPITSIGPILAVPGIRNALQETRATVAAISPIVGGAAVSGPAGDLMRAQGLPVSLAGIAQAYHDFLDVLIADDLDTAEASEVMQSNLHPDLRLHFCNTMMTTPEAKVGLARETLSALGVAAGGAPAPVGVR
jgi:LPPG:FO 2-phospho-L-lactate transferase